MVVVNSNQLTQVAVQQRKDNKLTFEKTNSHSDILHSQAETKSVNHTSSSKVLSNHQHVANTSIENLKRNSVYKYQLTKVATYAVEQYEMLSNLDKLQTRDKLLGFRDVA